MDGPRNARKKVSEQNIHANGEERKKTNKQGKHGMQRKQGRKQASEVKQASTEQTSSSAINHANEAINNHNIKPTDQQINKQN